MTCMIVVDGVEREMTPEEIAALPMTSSLPISSISRRQLILILLQLQIITEAEALAAAKTGDVPAAVQGYFSLLTTAEQLTAEISWATSSIYERNDPLVLGLATQLNLTSAQVDDFFQQAGAL